MFEEKLCVRCKLRWPWRPVCQFLSMPSVEATTVVELKSACFINVPIVPYVLYTPSLLLYPLICDLNQYQVKWQPKNPNPPLSLQSIYHLLNFKLANMTRSHRRQRACVLLGGEDYPKGWCFNHDTHFDPFFHRQSSSITLLRQSCFCLAVDRAASAVFFSLRKPTWDMSLPFWSCLCLRLGNMKWNTLC